MDDGGYREGILVDVDLEENMYGPFSEADLAHARRVADMRGVEPRILRRGSTKPTGEVQTDESLEKEHLGSTLLSKDRLRGSTLTSKDQPKTCSAYAGICQVGCGWRSAGKAGQAC